MIKLIKKTPLNESIDELCKKIYDQLIDDKKIRYKIPGDGIIFIDRPLPFLVVYREPQSWKDIGTKGLCITEASFVYCKNIKGINSKLKKIIETVQKVAIEKFGVFLLLEIWSRYPKQPPIVTQIDNLTPPAFRLYSAVESVQADNIFNSLEHFLKKISLQSHKAVIIRAGKDKALRNKPSNLLNKSVTDTIQIGIEIEPYYRTPDGDNLFPIVHRRLRSHIYKAIRYCFYHFIRQETKQRPKNFHVLGRRAVVKAVWDIDAQLNTISSSFNFLELINPCNRTELWKVFKKNNFQKLPQLRYLPLPIDISLTKRKLYSIPLERVDDPSFALIFNEKQEELDRRLTMLKERGTNLFFLSSLQLYGNITSSTTRIAEELLERVSEKYERHGNTHLLNYNEIKKLAEEEIAYYQSQWNEVQSEVKSSSNILSSLMVSENSLLIDPQIRIRLNRVDALIQHEIGTHLVTYYNGKAQPFTQLKTGFANYEELQEGLAILAEYLVGGLTRKRLRILAARVLAAKSLIDGATFIDTFRILCRYGFTAKQAFSITLRTYRGGGYIKDCIYLRGFQSVLNYIADKKDLKKLFSGKISLQHLPILDELLSRKVLSPIKLLPRYLEREECQKRLNFISTRPHISQLMS